MIFTFKISSREFANEELKEITQINIAAPTLENALEQFPNYHKYIKEAK